MIGIITSSTESYNLIKLCHQFWLEYMIFADTKFWPYQDKTDETLKERFELLATQAKKSWCTHFFVSPRIELLFKESTTILPLIPLFQSYLARAYRWSLIGKIGYFGGYYDVELINTLHKDLAQHHILTDKQKTTKKFLSPLAKRTKDTSMRTFFLRILSGRNMMINKIIKFDLKYFKDADVDTLIPLSRSYFNYQTSISSFFNPKKQKFHKREVVVEVFQELVEELKLSSLPKEISENRTIFVSGSPHLLQSKKREILASWGWKFKLLYEQF